MPTEIGPSLSAQEYAHQVGLELENSEMKVGGWGWPALRIRLSRNLVIEKVDLLIQLASIY